MDKYLKYKIKYLKLKSQLGGANSKSLLTEAVDKNRSLLTEAINTTVKPNVINTSVKPDVILEPKKFKLDIPKLFGLTSKSSDDSTNSSDVSTRSTRTDSSDIIFIEPNKPNTSPINKQITPRFKQFTSDEVIRLNNKIADLNQIIKKKDQEILLLKQRIETLEVSNRYLSKNLY